MSRRFVVTQTQPLDAALLVSDVRQADLNEWVLAGGRPVEKSLLTAIEASRGDARTMWLGADPLCIWGVNPTDQPGVGCGWLIGTNLGQHHARSMMRDFGLYLREAHEEFPTIDALAYAGNTLHHVWMERMGFARTGEERLLGLAATFIQFRRYRDQPQCA